MDSTTYIVSKVKVQGTYEPVVRLYIGKFVRVPLFSRKIKIFPFFLRGL